MDAKDLQAFTGKMLGIADQFDRAAEGRRVLTLAAADFQAACRAERGRLFHLVGKQAEVAADEATAFDGKRRACERACSAIAWIARGIEDFRLAVRDLA